MPKRLSTTMARNLELEVNSRNTALGASSPANPALHIPELLLLCQPSSWNPSIPCANLLRVAMMIELLISFGDIRLRDVVSYPLSMTRAATSSVMGTKSQHLIASVPSVRAGGHKMVKQDKQC